MLEGAIAKAKGQARTKLAYFLVGVEYPLRMQVYEAYKADADILVLKKDKPANVARQLTQTKFCIQADGNAPWSPRLIQYVFAGCVPVLLSDSLLPPFHDTLDWDTFSVTVSPANLHDIKRVLQAAPYEKLRANLEIAAKILRYEFGAVDYTRSANALSLLVYEMWRKTVPWDAPAAE